MASAPSLLIARLIRTPGSGPGWVRAPSVPQRTRWPAVPWV